MTKSQQHSLTLTPLEGELPPERDDAVTLMLCGHQAALETDILPALCKLSGTAAGHPVHVHVLDMTPEGLARLTLLGESLPHLDLSVTGETAPAFLAEQAPCLSTAFGLIRLAELQQRVGGRLSFIDAALAGHVDPADIFGHLATHDVLILDHDLVGLALTESDSARHLSAAIAQKVRARLATGRAKPENATKIVASAKESLMRQDPAPVGPFPLISQGDDPDVEFDESSWAASVDGLWIGKSSSAAAKRVLILEPDLALPFKSPALVASAEQRRQGSPFLTGSHGALRQAWRECFDQLTQALTSRGHAVRTLVRPGSQISPALANLSGADLVIMPHRQSFQCEGLEVPALYLMQIAHRWLFTVDPKGWGAGAQAYPYAGFADGPPDGDSYDRYARMIFDANESKFDQPSRLSRDTLVMQGVLPAENYIFFPCQIPDDEVVRYFCDKSEEDVIRALTVWANASKIHLVLKAHPAAPETARPFQDIAQGPYIHWTNASIHDLIENCQAVYTLNSGVGHEAILHGKPVVMFGRAEYDRVAIRTTVNDLDEAYRRVQSWGHTTALRDYKQFYHWFTRDMAIDFSDEGHLPAALSRFVDMVESL